MEKNEVKARQGEARGTLTPNQGVKGRDIPFLPDGMEKKKKKKKEMEMEMLKEGGRPEE